MILAYTKLYLDINQISVNIARTVYQKYHRKQFLFFRGCETAFGYSLAKCFLQKARPEPDFKYISNSNAFCLSVNAI